MGTRHQPESAKLCVFVLIVSFATSMGLGAEGQGKSGRGMDQHGDERVWRAVQTVSRAVPTPAPHHPGNVFVADEVVSVRMPDELSGKPARWRALDDRLSEVCTGSVEPDAAGKGVQVPLGRLGIGWYRVEFLDAGGKVVGWTTAAVLSRLTEPVPQDSPICLDAAISWLGSEDPAVQEDLVRLAALAGANWVRDRLRWREVQTGQNAFAKTTRYDLVAQMHRRAGLKVLQTFHGTPAWAVSEGGSTGRFPDDLRVAYAFCKAMGKRFKGPVQAWEPWNEANAGNFGGHTIDEMCSYQKAAYLGFKAGDPDVTVCWNPCGGINTPALAKGVLSNETWPYYDVYTIHSYDWPHAYESLWKPSRSAACGRAIWVTECDRGMKASSGPPWGDFSHEFARLKAEFMAQSYANSLYSGATRHFHFILGHYMEGQHSVQFGLLRLDRTPRLSYVALAALGRLLAGGWCLGRWKLPNQPHAYVYAFRARPDGVERDVLVAWAQEPVDWPRRGKTRVDWSLPKETTVESGFDYLGRPLPGRVPPQLTSAAIFLGLPRGQAERLPLVSVPRPTYRGGQPSPVVLQLQMPRSATISRREGWTPQYERTTKPGEPESLTIVAYNFGDKPARGVIRVENVPEGWSIAPDRWQVTLEPMARQVLRAQLTMPSSWSGKAEDGWVGFRGEFGDAGRPVLAFRVLVRPDGGESHK